MKKETASESTGETQNALKVHPFTRGPAAMISGDLAAGVKCVVVSMSEATDIAYVGCEGQQQAVAEADAELIAEAFSVSTETGLTPRQLADSHKELLAALKGMVEGYSSIPWRDIGLDLAHKYDHARAAIALAERDQP